MKTVSIAIVGGGLSGLYAALLLEQRGISDYVLLEADATLGGRIESVRSGVDQDRFDLGPTWFWPGYQQELDQLISGLELERFAQYESGDAVIERGAAEPIVRTRGYASAPPSMRLAGGMAALTEAIVSRLDTRKIAMGQKVRSLHHAGSHVEAVSEDVTGRMSTWCASHVLLALPPRLAAHIEFIPALPSSLSRQWSATPTWMAPHAKYVAVYPEPFWRRMGLSGEGRSARGPMGEIHDASMPEKGAALFGFLCVPASVRRGVASDVMRAHCRAQLVRMFGEAAANPAAEFLKDWAQEPLTATAADMDQPASHASAPASVAESGLWRGRLTGIASEWSVQFPGYLAGAVEAARTGVQALPQEIF